MTPGGQAEVPGVLEASAYLYEASKGVRVMSSAGAIFGVLLALVALILFWGDSGKPGPRATKEQLDEVDRLKKLGYSVAWLEDGTAMLYGGQVKAILVHVDGRSNYASAKHRNKRVPWGATTCQFLRPRLQ